MRFRSAITDDIDRIYEIEKRVFNDSWSYNSISEEFNGEKYSKIYVVENKITIIGYIFIRKIFNESHIVNFAIDIPFQHQGYGKFLLQKALENFNSNTNVFLEVKEANLPAIKLYSDLGFVEIDRKDCYYSDGSNAIFMLKKQNKYGLV